MNENKSKRGLTPGSKPPKTVRTKVPSKYHPTRVKQVKRMTSPAGGGESGSTQSLYNQLKQAIEKYGLGRKVQFDLSTPEKILVACVFVFASYVGFAALMNMRDPEEESEYQIMPDYYEGSKLTIKSAWIEYRQKMEALHSENIEEEDPEIEWGQDYDVM